MTWEQFFSFGWLTPRSCIRAVIFKYLRERDDAPKKLIDCRRYLRTRKPDLSKAFAHRYGFKIGQPRIQRAIDRIFATQKSRNRLREELDMSGSEKRKTRFDLRLVIARGKAGQYKTMQRIKGGR